MAELSITVAVTTGTQYVTGSTGSIFTFGGSQPASFTFPWVQGGTVRLEQSGSSNDGHPLIFSTSNSAVLATMKAGIISSGVTYYLDGSSNQSDYTNTTTFNAATTRYIEIAPTSQTDFYFACWVHGIGMGGIMDITQDTWGAFEWGYNDWGNQDTYTVFPTGLLTTGSLGDPLSYNEKGWGRSTWGSDDWGDFSLTVVPSSFSITGSLGEMVASSLQGWGRSTWGNEPWGDSNSPVVALTGYSITASLGTLPYAQSEEGWGRDEWGIGNWGENTTTVIPTGLEMTGLIGRAGWGRDTWGNGAWGEHSTLIIEIGESLTGLEITGSLGTPQINYDFKHILTQSLLGTLSLGSLSINNGADHTQGLGGIAATMSVGSLTVSDVVQGTGTFLATMSLGTVTVGELKLVPITGIASTMSQGSLGSIPDMARGLTGIAITGSVGSLTITDMQIGVSGLEISGTLGSGGVSPLHYKDVDIIGNTSYSNVDITGNTSYTDVDHAG